jgi:hypothetical protein
VQLIPHLIEQGCLLRILDMLRMFGVAASSDSALNILGIVAQKPNNSSLFPARLPITEGASESI